MENRKDLSDVINGKRILITGGTGSFGSQFIQTALKRYNPARIIVFSRDELKQEEMRVAFQDDRLSFFIGDVRDRDRLFRAFQADLDLVIHAAALKQVPVCEYNPFEAIKTNVLGGKNIIDAAIDCEVPRVVALSTDKAVNPVNLYGATKLCAEKLFTQGNSYAGGRNTRFSCIRYGNVIGSRGSVIPLFLEQRKSGRLNVTDKRMTRFWLTLEHAVEFVIESVGRMQGGEVFVPHIPSMAIVDMVNTIAPEATVHFSGIRPGEKLHETLISADEARHTVAVDDSFVILPEYPLWGSKSHRDARRLADDFAFTSNDNDRWLTPEELLELIGETIGDETRPARG